MEFEFAVFFGLIIAFAAVSAKVGRVAVTMPMVFVALGALTDAVGLIEFDIETEGVALLGEITLAVILFGDAVRIDIDALRRELGLPVRLLAIGLPLSVLLGAIGIALLLPSFGWWEAALVAAILAPTDAALGQAVVEESSVPLRVRQGLNVESGLNDGMVVPAVTLFTALALGEAESEVSFWGRFVAQQVGLGLLIGLVLGVVGGLLVSRAVRTGWAEGIYAQLATLSVALAAFAVAQTAEANGFIAAFVAGMAFGRVSGPTQADELDEYTEDTGRLLSMVAFFLFGNLFVLDALSATTVSVIACAALALTVGRIVPVAVAMTGLRAAWPTTLFVGWFGPRGLASILFGLLLLEEEALASAEELFAVIAWTVVASVFLHGATAGAGARAYGRWYASMSDEEKDTMPEGVMVTEHRAVRR
ncbi:MAG: cation:proton antiporter [Actinomycetota bacterium]